MNLMELMVKIGVDDQASKKVGDVASKVKSGLAGAAKAGAAAVATATAATAAGAVALGKSALDGYASYEQLVGGVNKLFGEASSDLMAYADKAYETAGMSANQYMETATSFSASLISGLSGDTKEAARLADVAMRAMSDNINTFGTDAESVQNAFMGFSKANYTMLDNLKLGYAGTKEGMSQLIADAATYTDVQNELGLTVDASSMSFDNIVRAIQVTQAHMGIAGTTMNEAAGTIEGSINMAKAAWENWVAALGNPDADMGALTDKLLEAIGYVADNVGPRLVVIAERVVEALPSVVQRIREALPDMIDSVLADVDTAFGTNLMGMGETVGAALDSLGTIFGSAMEVMAQAAQVVVPLVAQLLDIIAGLLPVVEALAPVLIPVATGLAALKVAQEVSTMFATLQTVVTGVMTAMSGVQSITGLCSALSALAGGPVTLVIAAVAALAAGVMYLWNTNEDFRNGVTSAWEAIKSFISSAGEAIGSAIQGIGEWFMTLPQSAAGALDGVVQWFGGLPGRIVSALGDLGSLLLNAGSSIINGLLNGIKSAFEGVKSFVGGIASWIAEHKGPLPYDRKLLVPAGEAIMGGFLGALEDGFSDVQGFVSGIGGSMQASVTVPTVAQAGGQGQDLKAAIVQALTEVGTLRLDADAQGLAVYLAPSVNRELGRLAYMGV